MLARAHPSVLPCAMRNDVGTPVAIISQLNTLPACAPVNASMAASRLAMHDSGSGWFAKPFLYDFFIHYSTPVYPGALRNLLLMHFDGSDHQFVMALDKRTGKTVWQTQRSIDFQDLDKNGKPAADGDLRKAFSTPQVERINGRWEMISLGAKAAYSYDPFTGRELWRVEERGQHSASTRPVVGHGMIFFPTGFSAGQLFAVRTGGEGLITDTHVVWKVKRSVSNKPSILLVDDLIYMIGDAGIASCIDAKTGEQVWQQRIGGEYSASPLYADGRLWFFSEDGKTTVLKPGRVFEQVGENRLDEGFLASPAIAGKAFYLRTRTHLYRIEEK